MTFAALGRAQDHEALKDVVLDRIRAAGPISFADFMALALYHPKFGYYMACDPAKDFQTSPDVHPLFGAVIGRTLAEMWRLMDRPASFDVFEAGAGSGRLANDVIRWLQSEEPAFADALRYSISDLRLAGPEALDRLERTGAPLDRIAIKAGFPNQREVEGCILSNELLDSLPFRRVQMRKGCLEELKVAAEKRRLLDVPVAAAPEINSHFAALGLTPGEGCLAEVNLEAGPWIARAAGALRRGYLLTFDYGYYASQLYAPWRTRGTLLTFYRMMSEDEPYVRIGRQDITASVDFTTVTRSAEAAGLRSIALAAQSEFLAACGISEALSGPDPTKLEGFFDLRRAVLTLCDPAGLGRIKVLLQGRGVPLTAPKGFDS